jgi:hypothetical protein
VGKILGKIPRKIFPTKMLGKIGIFRGKSFEKLFSKKFQEFFFCRKSLSAEKNVRKISPWLDKLHRGRRYRIGNIFSNRRTPQLDRVLKTEDGFERSDVCFTSGLPDFY